MPIGWIVSKVEGGSDWSPPPPPKASCNYFFFEASRVTDKMKTYIHCNSSDQLFLNELGIEFHNLVPILENEYCCVLSLDDWVYKLLEEAERVL